MAAGPTIRENRMAERTRAASIASALDSSGVTVVRVDEALEPAFGDLMEVLPAGFRRDIDNFLSRNPDIGLQSLEEIVEFNNASPTVRAPYGQGNLISALASSVSPRELEPAARKLESDSRKAIDSMLERHGIQVYVTLSNAYDQAGYPAITVPFGYSNEDGPSGVILSGSHLSEGALISTAFAFEQATRAWNPPVLLPKS